MPSLYTLTSGALASSQDTNQLVLTLTGQQNTPVSIRNTDPIAYTLQLQNTDAAGKTLLVYGPDGTTVILRSQGNGVVASPDGSAAASVVTTTHAQTLTNKTFTSPSLGGPLTLTDAVSRIVPGATSLSLRNSTNNADNLLITDAGVVTLRTLPLNLPGQQGGVAKAIAWADAGAGLTSILGNTVGGAPASNVLRFDIATGTAASSVTALTLDGSGTVSSGVGGFNNNAGTDVAGGGAVATLPTIGGTGPATAASQGWERRKISGFNRWVPFWA